MKYAVLIALSLFIFPFLGGCASLINDENQMVAFDSEPEGAYVLVDGVRMGKTPCVLPIPRKGWDKQIQFEKDGYKSEQYTLDNTLNGSLAGNLIFGGVVGLGVDAITGKGGGYQESVKVVLIPIHETPASAKQAQETPLEGDDEPDAEPAAATPEPDATGNPT